MALPAFARCCAPCSNVCCRGPCWDRQPDGRMGTVALHRPCWAYLAGGASQRASCEMIASKFTCTFMSTQWFSRSKSDEFDDILRCALYINLYSSTCDGRWQTGDRLYKEHNIRKEKQAPQNTHSRLQLAQTVVQDYELKWRQQKYH